MMGRIAETSSRSRPGWPVGFNARSPDGARHGRRPGNQPTRYRSSALSQSARLRSSNSRGCGVNQRLDFLRKTPPVRAEFVEQNRTEHYVAVLATLI
jgi:hypothetical protein